MRFSLDLPKLIVIAQTRKYLLKLHKKYQEHERYCHHQQQASDDEGDRLPLDHVRHPGVLDDGGHLRPALVLVRERFLGDGDSQKLAQGVPALLDVENKQPVFRNRLNDFLLLINIFHKKIILNFKKVKFQT